jgi:hypothetical protein
MQTYAVRTPFPYPKCLPPLPTVPTRVRPRPSKIELRIVTSAAAQTLPDYQVGTSVAARGIAIEVFAAMFLVGSYLLLRRSPSPPVSPGSASPGPRRFKTIMLNSGALLAVFGSLGIYLLVHQASVNQQKAEQAPPQQQAEYEKYEQWATIAIRHDELLPDPIFLDKSLGRSPEPHPRRL